MSSMNKITSALTSRKQLAATFKRVNWKGGTCNFDLGCGFWPEKIHRYLDEQDVVSLCYDPFTLHPHDNDTILYEAVFKYNIDTVTCNNVLNVIKDRVDRYQVLYLASFLLHPESIAYFLIHEGDCSGYGRTTKKDPKTKNPICYQLNKTADKYIPEILKHFSSIEKKGNLLVATK